MTLLYAREDKYQRGIYHLCSQEEATVIIVDRDEYADFWTKYKDVLDTFNRLTECSEEAAIEKHAKEEQARITAQITAIREQIASEQAARDFYIAMRNALIAALRNFHAKKDLKEDEKCTTAHL